MSIPTFSISATRRLQYAIGHRVFGHEGKCSHLHGHNFVFFLTAVRVPGVLVSQQLDTKGRVLDFAVLKEVLGSWIEQNWDHGFVLWEGDTEAIHAVNQVRGQKIHLLPYNPTAENLALYLITVVGPLLLVPLGCRLTKVKIFETENGIATVAREDR